MTNHLTANASFPVDRTACPETAAIIDAILAVWPEHMRYLQVNFSERDQGLLAFSEKVSAIIRQLSGHHMGGLAALAEDYRFLCQNIVLPEELYFRRHGTYRLKTFEDALAHGLCQQRLHAPLHVRAAGVRCDLDQPLQVHAALPPALPAVVACKAHRCWKSGRAMACC